MARFSVTVAQVVSEPQLLGDVLARFNADPKCEIPPKSREAVASTILTAVRHALRTGQTLNDLAPRAVALATDIRNLVPTLHVHAKSAAKLKEHQDASDAEGRAHRFVEWLTGGRRYDERSRVDWPCPEVMLPLVPYSSQPNAKSYFSLLYRLSLVAGIPNAPARFPSADALVEAVFEVEAPTRGRGPASREDRAAAKKRVQSALSYYRAARNAMLEDTPQIERNAVRARYCAAPRFPVGRAVHLGVHAEVHAVLHDVGLIPEEMSPFEILRAIAPALAEDFEAWRDSAGHEQSPSFIEQCEDALIRVGGWAVKAGLLDRFRAAEGLDDLLVQQIESTERAKLNPRQQRKARRRGEEVSLLTTTRVSLLEAMVEGVAAESLERSPVAAEEVPPRSDGKPYLIYALYAATCRIWSMTEALYAATALASPEEAQRWAMASANWSHLLKEFKERKLKGEHIAYAKNKEKLIRLVTLPLLQCVAFPMRQRELRRMRARWQQADAAAREAGHDPEMHASVRAAREAYFSQALQHCMLAVSLDDGMRRQQYQHGRLGAGKNFHPLWIRRAGREHGEIEGLRGVETNWTGDKSDPAHFKIRERDEKLATRLGRDARPGVVPMDILWDIITEWRPRELVRAGLVASLLDYNLDADMRDGRWALFVSGDRTLRIDDENSRTDVSDKVGRELHYLASTFVRPPIDGEPQIPAWDDLTDEWRSLWAQHVTRLLNTSYHGGVRGDWGTAMYLSQDTEQTLRDEYSVVDHAIRDKLGLDRTHWEHPNAYDVWMDRLLKGREVFDPLDDPSLPLPPHVRRQLDEERAAARRRRAASGNKVRIRQRRSTQSLPANARNAKSVNSAKYPTAPRRP